MGDVVVGPAETVDGITFVPVSVGNPHAVVIGDPATIGVIGPELETHSPLPGPHERAARRASTARAR